MQPYLVLTFCRMLNCLETGKVVSKVEAAEWAFDSRHSEWTTLIRGALEERPDPWLRVHQRADPETVERTLEFIEYCLREAAGRQVSILGQDDPS